MTDTIEEIAKLLMKIYNEDNCNEINKVLLLIEKIRNQTLKEVEEEIENIIWDWYNSHFEKDVDATVELIKDFKNFIHSKIKG